MLTLACAHLLFVVCCCPSPCLGRLPVQVHYVLFASEMDDFEQFSQRLPTWNAGVGQGGFNKPKTFPPDHSLP